MLDWNEYSQKVTFTPSIAPQFDTLSAALDGVRVDHALWSIIYLPDKSGLWASPAHDLQFILVYAGTAYLETNGSILRLEKGDCVLRMTRSKFVVKQSPLSLATCTEGVRNLDRRSGQPILTLGKGPPRATLICASFSVDQTRWNLIGKSFPDVVHTASVNGTLPDWTGPLGNLSAFNLLGLGPGADAMLCRLAEICIIQSLRTYAEHTGSTENAAESFALTAPQINIAVQLMNSNPEINWSVSALADKAGMSRSTFAAAFTSIVGLPPIRYLTELRIRRAQELLRFGKLSVSEVAFKVGYDSVEGFARAFKRECGLMPRLYRKVQG